MNPKQVQEKADILETNLFKTVSKQKDPSQIQLKINRSHFPDPVIHKALLQLMPRFNIKPSLYIMGLRDLMKKKLSTDQKESFYTELSNQEETMYADDKVITRGFEAVLSKKELQVTISGTPSIPSVNGEIAKSFFNHEQSAGKLLKDGIINFKEINRYPIVNAGDKLFYVTHEKQGSPGISFDGLIVPVSEAAPMAITIGPGVEKIDDIDKKSAQSKGYYLQALKTGVVVLDRKDDGIVRGIEISDEMTIKRLDYSVGNIGTQYTCPIQAKIGVICNGFRIRINGLVQADVSEGAEITTNNEAHISLVQTGSKIIALKDVHVHSSSGSTILSEEGCVTVNNELIDSKIEAPKIVFEKNKGLLTNNTIEANKVSLNGMFFSGVNIINFGNNLFTRKEEMVKSIDMVTNKLQELANNEKLLMGRLQIELKRMAKLTTSHPDIVSHIRPLILATKTMDYKAIFHEMDLIQEKYNTKVILNTRKIFETLEKIPVSTKVYLQKKETLKSELKELDREMTLMKIDIEGMLRKAATIKVFCGSLKEADISKPDFILESEGEQTKYIKVTGTYSHEEGFEFVQ